MSGSIHSSSGAATITVVIPVFNRTTELARALESLRHQTDPEFDVVVCDDGSTEDIAAVVEPYRELLRLTLLSMPNSGGPATPRNIGWRHSNAEWISFLDSDDWWAKERMATVKAALDDASDVVYHQLQRRGPSAEGKVLGRPLAARDPLAGMLADGNPLATSAVLVRRHCLETMGGFDEDPRLASVEDFDLWLRLAAAGARFRFVQTSLGFYWQGGDQISRFDADQYDRQNALFLKHQQSLPVPYRAMAKSHFSYLLGSYGLALGRADAASHLRQVVLRYGLIKWFKAFLKRCYLLSRGLGRG
jgi:glycosyltransferase involved in cell wall biosynthesis